MVQLCLFSALIFAWPFYACVAYLRSLGANESEGGLFWMGIGLFFLGLDLIHFLYFPHPVLSSPCLQFHFDSSSGFSFFHFFFSTPSAPLQYHFHPFPFYLLCLNVLRAGAFIHGIVVVKERIGCAAKKLWSVHLWSVYPWCCRLLSFIVGTETTCWPLVICPTTLGAQHLVRGEEKEEGEGVMEVCSWERVEEKVTYLADRCFFE